MTITEAILVLSSFIISIFNAAIGPTGGLSLVIMASLVPPAAVVPLHGAVESASSIFRVAANWRYIDWRIALTFGVGAIVGGLVGASISLQLPGDVLQIVIGAFILFSVWGPKPKGGANGGWRGAVLGAISSFVAMLGGSIGALIMVLIGSAMDDRRGLIGTQSACVAFVHMFKMIAFGILGFVFAPYLYLIVMMIVATFFGGLLGRHVLDRVPEEMFRRIIKILVTLLAVRMLAIGFGLI
tara:strand:+ start:2612 stop:3334 length:723 start_codon:yes stop_codon:yes gene_type:complete